VKQRHFILYVAEGEIFQAGPFDTREDAWQWAEENADLPGKPGEFDINDQHVYHLRPDGSLVEISAADIGR
jgi:hypothetical protein